MENIKQRRNEMVLSQWNVFCGKKQNNDLVQK